MRCNKHYFSLLAVAAFALPAAANDANLKVYSGPFIIKHVNEGIKGTAEYTYKDAPDGTRIFQGPFKFKADPEAVEDILVYFFRKDREERDQIIKSGLSLTIEGNFDNDYQVGEWKWSGPWPIYYLDPFYKNQIIKFTFSSDGKMEGPASFIGEDGDSYTFTITDNKPIGTFNLTTAIENYTLKGTWRNGHPIGTWTKSPWSEDAYERTRYIRFSDSGVFIESYSIDDMTGDKLYGDDYDYRYSHDFNPSIFKRLDFFLMRRTLKDFKRHEGYDEDW
ncbi:MAG: hypothetical protein HDS73_02815 [Bacteroidales bacterium]|nr:hypothetical protein [Bacteroidales bacterium]